MRRRFLCVLSGNARTRGRYRWDFGASPAIAVNEGGDLVLAFVDESGDVFCWSGKADPAGAVAWRRRNPYEDRRVGLQAPAVAIGDDGWVVAAFRFDGKIPNALWSRLGHLDGDGRINWFASNPVATGRAPSLAIRGRSVTEIHERPGGGREKVTATIDTVKRKVEWGKPRATQEPRFPVDIAAWGAHTLACGTHPKQAWLGTSFDNGALLPVRLTQLAFVELRRPAELPTLLDPLFFAAPAKDKAAIAWARARTPPLVARAFDYEDGDGTVENIPSTDLLATQAYREYTDDAAV